MVLGFVEGHGGDKELRRLKMSSSLKRFLANLLERGEWRDDSLYGRRDITITFLKLRHDLSHADIFFSIRDDGTDQDAVALCQALNEQAPYMRHLLRRHLRVRSVPRLVFRLSSDEEVVGDGSY